MPQSLSAVYVHLVFSTKERRPFLHDSNLRAAMHCWLGEVSRRLDCPPVAIGGVEDHVHLLARLGRTTAQAEWVKELKRVSNDWMQKQGAGNFQWQSGYAAFSVSQSSLEAVTNYIRCQEQHHQKHSFQDELRTFLRKHHLEWDERYLWD
jgi:REP element-mobilizing transposase RayT